VVKATKKGTKLFTNSINQIHVITIKMEDKRVHIQELLLEKQLQCFQSWNETINQNQENMVVAYIGLTMMSMAFGRTTNNNTTQVHATTKKDATKGENKCT
jgi:hypothetical protein